MYDTFSNPKMTAPMLHDKGSTVLQKPQHQYALCSMALDYGQPNHALLDPASAAKLAVMESRHLVSVSRQEMSTAGMITIRFAGWISGRIVSLQPDTDIQKLLPNGKRISETLSSIFRGFRLFWKKLHCIIIHSLSSEASLPPSVPWLLVCLWCKLCSVV